MHGCLPLRNCGDQEWYGGRATGRAAGRRRDVVRLRRPEPQDIEYVGTSLESILGAESMVGAARQVIREALLEATVGGGELAYVAGPLPAGEYEDGPRLAAILDALVGAGCVGIYCGPYLAGLPEFENVAVTTGTRGTGRGLMGISPDGLGVLADRCRSLGLAVIVGVRSVHDIAAVRDYADVLEVNAHSLIEPCGLSGPDMVQAVIESGKPVLLSRGAIEETQEWLGAADRIISAGNPNVILYENAVPTTRRNPTGTPDLVAAAIAKSLSSLPVIVNIPYVQHPAGISSAVAKAAIVAGSDGLVLGVCDGSGGHMDLDPKMIEGALKGLIQGLSQVARLAGKR